MSRKSWPVACSPGTEADSKLAAKFGANSRYPRLEKGEIDSGGKLV
uniref:Uncharacterized protein n=1 Tax=Arthrobacter sp. J3.40 TaxID=347209 RepID=I3W160_9MICC|nr:hypothetical protein [Arthrobacter sp. J3.40]